MQIAEPQAAQQFPGEVSDVMAQLGTLKESIRRQRQRSLGLWNACSSNPQEAEAGRAALGKYTQQLLRKQSDAACT